MKTISDVKRANKEAGNFFFERKTMNFFKSKIESTLLKGKYFITSEQYKDEPRKYTLREVADDASINTVGSFQQFRTKADAKSAVPC